MSQSTSATIKGPNGPLDVVFAEATPTQRLACCEIIVASFALKSPASTFLRHEVGISQLPLSLNQGMRTWCLSLADDPNTVVALCKTVGRRLLIRDSDSIREEHGYCVSTVATHPQYRRRGLATFLIERVSEWLDGPAGVAMSMLYTSAGNVSVDDEMRRSNPSKLLF